LGVYWNLWELEDLKDNTILSLHHLMMVFVSHKQGIPMSSKSVFFLNGKALEFLRISPTEILKVISQGKSAQMWQFWDHFFNHHHCMDLLASIPRAFHFGILIHIKGYPEQGNNNCICNNISSSAGNNSRSSDIVSPNFENIWPILYHDCTQWLNITPTQPPRGVVSR